MFPADCLPVPVYVYYDCRGHRWFADGLKRLARSFFAAKLKPVKYPRVVRADRGRLFKEPAAVGPQAMPN